MKVRELIEFLQLQDPELDCVVKEEEFCCGSWSHDVYEPLKAVATELWSLQDNGIYCTPFEIPDLPMHDQVRKQVEQCGKRQVLFLGSDRTI